MIEVATFASVLGQLSGTSASRTFARVTPAGVVAQAIARGESVRAIHFSERQNRYSRDGILSLYVAEDLDTACCEMSGDPTLTRAREVLTELPMLTFSVRAVGVTLLDLTSPTVLTALKTTEAEITGPWRHLSTPTAAAPTQELGRAVLADGRFHGILYWSAVALRGGRKSLCAAFFAARLSSTAYIEIVDKSGRWLERWPPTP